MNTLSQRPGRRAFIASLGAAILVKPGEIRAQNSTRRRVGILLSAGTAGYELPLRLFRQGLSEAGFGEGADLAFEQPSTESGYDAVGAAATRLVELRVDAIAAFGMPAALAAKAATPAIPVVFIIGADPVEMGLVQSLSSPGANLTGITQYFGELGGKRLEFLREIMPRAQLVAILVNPDNPNSQNHLANLQRAADAMNLRLHVARAATASEIDAAFAAFVAAGAEALVVADDPFFSGMGERIVALAARHALPSAFWRRQEVEAGGLFCYSVNPAFAYRQGGLYVGRILAGAAPTSLPVLQPTTFELIINLRTARTLGLSIPPGLLARADEVIE
jgi:putative ABC transport system substrate-binding protein